MPSTHSEMRRKAQQAERVHARWLEPGHPADHPRACSVCLKQEPDVLLSVVGTDHDCTYYCDEHLPEPRPARQATSLWRQRQGEVPCRVILRNVGGHQPWATHLACRQPDDSTITIAGHYFTTLRRALDDFEDRARREAEACPIVVS